MESEMIFTRISSSLIAGISKVSRRRSFAACMRTALFNISVFLLKYYSSSCFHSFTIFIIPHTPVKSYKFPQILQQISHENIISKTYLEKITYTVLLPADSPILNQENVTILEKKYIEKETAN